MKSDAMDHNHLNLNDRNSMLAIARAFARYVRPHNPYLRLMAVSGSLSHQESELPHNDIDFFIITRQGKVWEAFLGCLWYGWRFTRSLGLPRTFLCFNYMIDESYPQEIDLASPRHVRNFLNLEVILGNDHYLRLLEQFDSRLSAAEPELYERRLRKNRFELSLPTNQNLNPEHKIPFLRKVFYAFLRAPFIIVTKLTERRRRYFFPQGIIYSNHRVIRSHLHRDWNNGNIEDSRRVDGVFSSVAAGYEKNVLQSDANRHMRSIVYKTLEKLITPGFRVLDIGAGTGKDAIWLARHGARVLATDVARGMLQEAAENIKNSSLEDDVQVRRLAVEDLESLLPEHSKKYDLVLANFGVLNICGYPEQWGPLIARLLKPGGLLVATVMNRWCLWELVAGVLCLKPSFAFRRWRGRAASVGGHPLNVVCYSPAQFRHRLADLFELKQLTGLCAVAPPPSQGFIYKNMPWLGHWLRKIDVLGGRSWFFRVIGDHYLVVMQKRTIDLYSLKSAKTLFFADSTRGIEVPAGAPQTTGAGIYQLKPGTSGVSQEM